MKTTPYYIIVAALFLALVSGSLTTTGRFMDGLIYSNVAANMAEGVGSFWQPTYTATHHCISTTSCRATTTANAV